MPNPSQWAAARARQTMQAELRAYFLGEGFLEVETPLLVPTPGMEPHITAFQVPFVPEMALGKKRSLYLHTSPEYAMKRLLAEGSPPLFQLCKVFRNGEVSGTHNPEFTLLEFYRPHADYHAIMADLEASLSRCERAVGKEAQLSRLPYERVSVREALLRETGIDLARAQDLAALSAVCSSRLGLSARPGDTYDDLFFRVFLEKVEPKLGRGRPTFLIEYPASMASLARLKPGDDTVAERFELYVDGLELANGFSELTDAREQRMRLEDEQEQRRATGREVYPLDERFLGALEKMPPAGGVAVGLDRVLMLLTGAAKIEDVLLFPAHGFV